jgi:hypothetical protein
LATAQTWVLGPKIAALVVSTAPVVVIVSGDGYVALSNVTPWLIALLIVDMRSRLLPPVRVHVVRANGAARIHNAAWKGSDRCVRRRIGVGMQPAVRSL